MSDHEHQWGPVEQARMTGNPHRKCQHPGCREITLDLTDDDDLFPDLTEEDERQEELSADAERRAMNRLWERLEGD